MKWNTKRRQKIFLQNINDFMCVCRGQRIGVWDIYIVSHALSGSR